MTNSPPPDPLPRNHQHWQVDAIQTAHVETLQGLVSVDQYGDINDRTISVFQAREDSKYPVNDVRHQYKYLGVAPQSA